MNTETLLKHKISEIDLNNLQLLDKIVELTHDFKSFANSINEIFYLYVQNCLFTNQQLQITLMMFLTY